MRINRCSLVPALLLAASPLGAQLTIQVRVPASTPPGSTVHVAGSFNGWNPSLPRYALTPRGDGTLAVTLPDSVRGVIEFKFTRGSWETVETSASGAGIPNRSFTIPRTGASTVTATIEGWSAGKAAARVSTASKSVTVLSDSFAIPQLGRTRRVLLYLPPDYATSGKRYPVLYVHDAQNVFDDATSFAARAAPGSRAASRGRRCSLTR